MQLVENTLIHSGKVSDDLYLNGYDLITTHVGSPTILFYPQGLDLDVLKNGLKHALTHYPMLTGRVKKDAKGFEFFHCGDQGLSYQVFQHDEPFPDVGIHNPLRNGLRKYFKTLLPWGLVDRDKPLVYIQVHSYKDGGVVLSFNNAHSLFDGSGKWVFIQDWAKACRGETISPPCHDRSLLTGEAIHRFPSRYDKNYVMAYPDWKKSLTLFRLIKNVIFPLEGMAIDITGDQVEKLKALITKELGDANWVSTQDMLIAMLCQGMKINRSGTVYNLRRIKDFILPHNYIGNAIDYAEVFYSNEQLNNASFAELALSCKQQCIDNHPLSLAFEYAAFLEEHRQNQTIGKLFIDSFRASFAEGMVLNNYIRFPIYKIDFGTGFANWYEFPVMPGRAAVITSRKQNDGGVYINLTATKKDIAGVRAYLDNLLSTL